MKKTIKPPAGNKGAAKPPQSPQITHKEPQRRKGNRRAWGAPKPFYKSLTVWVNVISVVAIVIEQQLELLKPIMSETSYALLAIAVASVNLYLRLYVHRPLEFRKHDNNQDNTRTGV